MVDTMRLFYICFLVCFFGCSKVHSADWLRDWISEKGLELGNGVVLKLDHSKMGRDLPLLERVLVDFSISDNMGVSIGKVNDDGVAMDFYYQNNNGYNREARKKKGMDRYIIPMVLGYKTALIASVFLGLIKLMAIKALILAKAALILSLIVFITKLKSNKEQELVGTYWSVPATGFSAGGHQPMRAAAQASNVYPEVLYPPTGNSNVMMNPMFPHGPGVQPVHSMRSLQSSEQSSGHN